MIYSQPWQTRKEPLILIEKSIPAEEKPLEDAIKKLLPTAPNLQIVIAESYEPSSPMFDQTPTSKLYKLEAVAIESLPSC